MIKLSEYPQFRKLHQKQPLRAMLIFGCLIQQRTGGGLLTICKTQHEPYPFFKTEYERYVFASIGKFRMLMPKEKLFAFREMINAGVDLKVMGNYVFDNLYMSMEN